MNKRWALATLGLGVLMLVLAHYWPEFRAGMEYPWTGECK